MSTDQANFFVALIAVQSLDGFMTRRDEPGTDFASPEDQQWFRKILSQFDAVIMGAETYRAAKAIIRKSLTPDRPKYILTRNPEAFTSESVAGQLIFSNQTPEALLQTLRIQNRNRIALVGGAQTNARFLQANCVTQLWLTLEPVLFGQGTPLAPVEHPIQLKLLSTEQLGPSTLLLKYEILL